MKDANTAITLLENWPGKNSGFERDSNPRPLCYRCNARPTELSKPHESGRVWVRLFMFSGRNTRLKYMSFKVIGVQSGRRQQRPRLNRAKGFNELGQKSKAKRRFPSIGEQPWILHGAKRSFKEYVCFSYDEYLNPQSWPPKSAGCCYIAFPGFNNLWAYGDPCFSFGGSFSLSIFCV